MYEEDEGEIKMLYIGICDDGENFCAVMEAMVLHYTKEKRILADIHVWYSGETLCDYLRQNNHLDILFLDIEMLQMTGIEAGNFIRNQLEDRGMQIIYVSGNQSYAQELFDTQPMNFLVKPIEQSQIDKNLNLAIKLSKKNTEKFKFQNGKDYHHIPFGKIIYFYSDDRKIKIVTSDDEKEFYGKLKEVVNELPDSFVMIHQSYVVNKAHIIYYTYEKVDLMNGISLRISKAYRKEVREKILKEERK